MTSKMAICLWFAGAFMTDEAFGDERDDDSREEPLSGERPDV